MRRLTPSPSKYSYDPYGLAGVLLLGLSGFLLGWLFQATLAHGDTHYDTLERRNAQGVSEPVGGAAVLVRKSADCSTVTTTTTDEDGNWSIDIPASADYDLLFYVCAAGAKRGQPCRSSLDCGGQPCGVSQPNVPLVKSGGATGTCP